MDSHVHITFGDSHYLCLLGPQNELVRSILKENCFPNEKTNCFHLVLQGAPSIPIIPPGDIEMPGF